jgi:hypothetical protein
MRPEEAKAAPRAEPKIGTARRWNDTDYLVAAAVTAALIAPAPVFWAPPIWVVALMQPLRPS